MQPVIFHGLTQLIYVIKSIMLRIFTFTQAVREALPISEGNPRLNVHNLSVWIHLMTDTNTIGKIPDEIVIIEYKIAINLICSAEYPMEFIQTLYKTMDKILATTKNISVTTDDSLKNKVFGIGEKCHTLCIRILKDITDRYPSV